MQMTPREIMAACDVAHDLAQDEKREQLLLMAIATNDPKQAVKLSRGER